MAKGKKTTGSTSSTNDAGKTVKTQRERFESMVSPRVSKVIAALGHVGRFGNKSNYQMTEDEANQIMDAIGEAYHKMRDSLKNGPSAGIGFRLKSE